MIDGRAVIHTAVTHTPVIHTPGSHTPGTVTDALIGRVQQRLAQDRIEPTAAAVAAALRAETDVVVSDAQMLGLIRQVQRELVGAGPLSELLADPETTDVVVNGPQDVRMDRGQGWERTAVTFTDDPAVARLARRLAASAGRRLDDAHPFVDAQLADGTRLHAVLSPPAVGGTTLSLRVLRPTRYDLDALEEAGAFPGGVRTVLDVVVRARLAFLISGGTGTGKTTLLAAMLGTVPPGERIITVEDAGELRPVHPHLVQLIARADNVEGHGRIDLRELVRQALRMRPDRLVVGEVRGAEVVDLLAALNTGHDGGCGTVHANAVTEVPARLEALGAIGGLDRRGLHAQLSGAVQVVIHLARSGIGGSGRGGRAVAGIGLLQRDRSGTVVPVPVLGPRGEALLGAELLGELIRSRGVDPGPLAEAVRL